MRFRETNHLRKLANEMGKQMRSPRKSRWFKPLTPEQAAPNCGCVYSVMGYALSLCPKHRAAEGSDRP